MRLLFTLLFSFVVASVLGQTGSTIPLRGDRVRIYKQGGYADLILENSTKDSTGGLAINIGGGKFKFVKPRKLNDTTIVIGLDTFSVGTGSAGMTEAEVQALIDDALTALDNEFDEETIIGEGTPSDKRRVNTTLIPTRETTDSLHARIDSIVTNFPIGPGSSSRTAIRSTSIVGDSILIKLNDSTYVQKKFINGTNTTVVKTDSTIAINATSGSAEVNTLSTTIATTGTVSVPSGSMIDYVLVKPASNLTGFKIGIASDDDKYFPATPVLATSDFVQFDVGAYVSSTTSVQFSGITSSTQILLVYKPMHQ